MNNKTEPQKPIRGAGVQRIKRAPLSAKVAKVPPKQRSKGGDKR